MPRHLLGLFAIAAVAAAVALAIARPGALSNQGSFAQPAAAVADAEPSATPWAYIDKINNGEGWCDPAHIDNETTEYVGDSHQLAVCMGNLSQPVYGFILYLSYDVELDQCVEESCTDDYCLDDNPDANAGATKWGDGLGDNWDCSGSAQRGPDPMCTYYTSGPPELPYIWCEGGDGATYTLGDDETWGVLAVIDFNVIGVGTDNVAFESLSVWGEEAFIGGCQAVEAETIVTSGRVSMPCVGATDIKKQQRRSTPTPTDEPTATATRVPPTVPPTVPPPPPATPTPFGGAGPAIVAPATGSGPTAGGAPWAVWLAAGAVGVAAATSGFYLRRKTR